MTLAIEPLTAENVEWCMPLWADRDACTTSELDLQLRVLRRLLYTNRARGHLIRADRRVHAYGVTTFASEPWIERYLAHPSPQIGKQLLISQHGDDRSSILDDARIAAGNRGDGLQLVVLSTNYDDAGPYASAALGLLFRGLPEMHRGYRIKRFVDEVFGAAAVNVMVGSNAFEVPFRFRDVGGVPGLESVVCTLDAKQAAGWSPLMLPLFEYSVPQVRFTANEQELLVCALTGGTDEMLSARLGLPLSTIKARWLRIQARMAKTVPDFFDELPSRQGAHRGVQTRHLILQYVRDRPSELTPYASEGTLAAIDWPASRYGPYEGS